MTAADQTPAAERCGECRLGLGVHTPTDPYCDHHQTPSTDSPKMIRETLCVAQTAILGLRSEDPRTPEHAARLQRLIDEVDRQRPLGPDGKRGNRHTPTCGCEDTPATDSERVEKTLRVHAYRIAYETPGSTVFGCWGCDWQGDSSSIATHQADMLAVAVVNPLLTLLAEQEAEVAHQKAVVDGLGKHARAMTRHANATDTLISEQAATIKAVTAIVGGTTLALHAEDGSQFDPRWALLTDLATALGSQRTEGDRD